MKSAPEVLSLYGISAKKIEPMTGGLINKTWKAQARDQVYTLQWVSPVFSPKIMQDLVVMIPHLKAKGLITLEIIKTKNGDLYVQDEEGFWRVLTYIPGIVHNIVSSTEIAREAGVLLGRFHKALSDLKHKFHYARPLHRQSKDIYEKYCNTVNGRPDIFDIKFKKKIFPINDIPSLLLPETLPHRITHGDPKITNIIFGKNNKAIAMIDLDDSGNQHNTLVDIGDALCSWCKNADSTLSIPLYKGAVGGYIDGSQGLLSKQEKELIPQALKLITLELASRFAIDMAEDYYFGWDEKKYPSRLEHNRERVLGLIKFYQDIIKHEKELSAFVN